MFDLQKLENEPILSKNHGHQPAKFYEDRIVFHWFWYPPNSWKDAWYVTDTQYILLH